MVTVTASTGNPMALQNTQKFLYDLDQALLAFYVHCSRENIPLSLDVFRTLSLPIQIEEDDPETVVQYVHEHPKNC